jgi:hypothetical protein
MAIGPLPTVDYNIDVTTPFQAAVQGLQFAAGRETLEAARNQRELEAQARQTALAQQQQYQSGLNAFFAKPPAERRIEELQPLLLGANKQQFDALKLIGENMGAEQKNAAQRFTSQLLLSLESAPEVAKTMLQERIGAEQDPNQKRALETILKIAEVDPAQAANRAEALGAGMFGDDWYKGITAVRAERRTEAQAPAELRQKLAAADKAEAEAKVKMETATDDIAKAKATREFEQAKAEKEKVDAQVAEATKPSVISEAASKADKARVEAAFAERLQQAGLNKTNWDIKNLQSQIGDRAAKLNLDRQTTQATVAEKLSAIQQRLTDIPDGAMKLINEAATQSATSKQAATQYNDLAQRIESAEGGKGRFTSAAEWFAAQTGRQDAWTQIRNEYTRIRNTVAIKSLPPGPATDADIQLALKGIPPETANAATLASFLRGTAKLQDIDSAISNAKTDWLSQNKGVLTRAKTPFIAGDYAAKPGETFNDFAQRIVADVSAKYRPAEQVTEERRQQLISQIPTNQAPAAAAPSSSIEAQADAIIRGGR